MSLKSNNLQLQSYVNPRSHIGHAIKSSDAARHSHSRHSHSHHGSTHLSKHNPRIKLIFGIICTIAIIVIIVIVVIVVKKNKPESFALRGYAHPKGQMIYGDIPEKISAGGEEYDNPLYDEVSSRWTPTNNKVNGYTVWKQLG